MNIRQIRRINSHPGESNNANTPESISATNDWLHWHGNLKNPIKWEEDYAADHESDISQNYGINCLEYPE